MEIAPAQLVNPGIFEYDDTRRKEIGRYKKAVDQAHFLDDRQRERWKGLGYLLNNAQLGEAQALILAENLHRLQAQQKLERLKSKQN